MADPTLEHNAPAVDQSAFIRGLCERGISDGTDIWDVLEAQGIHATPGLICQAIASSVKHPHATTEAIGAEETTGLTADDVQMLARIARKAGGLDCLRAMLAGMHGIVK